MINFKIDDLKYELKEIWEDRIDYIFKKLTETDTNKLLEDLEGAVEEIRSVLDNNIHDLHSVISKHAITAYLVYRKLTLEGIEPRISTRLATNRYEQTCSHPIQIEFWNDYDPITYLYESLKKDGFYEEIAAASA